MIEGQLITVSEDLVGTMTLKCPACRMPATHKPTGKVCNTGQIHEIVCSRCGSYFVAVPLYVDPSWAELTPRQRANISGYFRENAGTSVLTTNDIEFLAHLATPSVASKASKFLRQFCRHHPIPGTSVTIFTDRIADQARMFLENRNTSYSVDHAADRAAMTLFPPLSCAWAETGEELRFLIHEYLVEEMNHLKIASHGKSALQVTPKGWAEVQANGIVDSSTGFVAMCFHNELDEAWEKAIYPAVKEAGYTPLRLDKTDHNNRVDDEIIASIRGSKFLVADFTLQRGGVYYEAGFAAGLAKPVICCVRSNDSDKLHFDIRQFNHIKWREDALPAFKDELKQRILATIGQGPVRVDGNTV